MPPVPALRRRLALEGVSPRPKRRHGCAHAFLASGRYLPPTGHPSDVVVPGLRSSHATVRHQATGPCARSVHEPSRVRSCLPIRQGSAAVTPHAGAPRHDSACGRHAATLRPRIRRSSTPTLLPAGAIEALALCDAPLPVRLSLPPCSSRARGEPVATVRALPACAARCFCRHAADSAHSPWPEPCTFLRLCVALLRSEGMHRRLQDPVSMREEEVHRTF